MPGSAGMSVSRWCLLPVMRLIGLPAAWSTPPVLSMPAVCPAAQGEPATLGPQDWAGAGIAAPARSVASSTVQAARRQPAGAGRSARNRRAAQKTPVVMACLRAGEFDDDAPVRRQAVDLLLPAAGAFAQWHDRVCRAHAAHADRHVRESPAFQVVAHGGSALCGQALVDRVAAQLVGIARHGDRCEFLAFLPGGFHVLDQLVERFRPAGLQAGLVEVEQYVGGRGERTRTPEYRPGRPGRQLAAAAVVPPPR